MGKGLFLLSISSIIGVIFSSNMLTAADTVILSAPEFKAVETIEVIEPLVDEPKTYTQIMEDDGVSVFANSISIAGQTLEVVDVAGEAVESGYGVNRYGGKFLYGHNYAAVLGGMTGLGAGAGFSINNGGVTKNYVVAKTQVFEKNGEFLQINGRGTFMNAVINATFMGEYYDLAIMTCYGENYENGDASHRFVVFANEV